MVHNLSMICKHCGFENRDGASFCINCGTNLEGSLYCPKCHGEVSVNDEICPHCKEPIKNTPLEPLSDEEESKVSKKEKNNKIFHLVFLILSLVLFNRARICLGFMD